MQIKNMNNRQSWEELGITSDYIFGKVMQDKELCEELLRRVFPDFHISNLQILELQKEIRSGFNQRYIRMDVFAEDGIRKFDVEMQMYSHQGMVKRTRYYHSMIDSYSLRKREPYSKLKDTYVIFFCPFDPFGEGKSIYRFRNISVDNHSLELNDGNETIFISSKGDREGVSTKLGNFLDLMEGATGSKDEFVLRVKEEISRAKINDEWRQEYMFIEDMQAMWFEYGEEKGRIKTFIELVKNNKLELVWAAKACDMTEEEFVALMERADMAE